MPASAAGDRSNRGVIRQAAGAAVAEYFSDAGNRARLERLWQAGAYLGSYGDPASRQISQHVRNWKATAPQEQRFPLPECPGLVPGMATLAAKRATRVKLPGPSRVAFAALPTGSGLVRLRAL